MDLTDAQLQSLADQVAERIQPRVVPAYAAGQPPMVQLPPEFYQSQREIAERVARLEERFEAVDKRFEAVDKRFDDLIHYMDKRFSFQQWLIGVGFLVLTTLMTVYQFLA
jgi:hypothetical protein